MGRNYGDALAGSNLVAVQNHHREASCCRALLVRPALDKFKMGHRLWRIAFAIIKGFHILRTGSLNLQPIASETSLGSLCSTLASCREDNREEGTGEV